MSGRQETPEELDSAIDALLGQPGRLHPVDEGELRATARLLRDVLPRFHPRFGFEERLAAHLANDARAGAGSSAARHPATIVPFPGGHAAAGSGHGPRQAIVPHVGAPGGRRRRGLVAGGAIASGVSLVIPIAGAAVVAWRRLRAPDGLT